MLAAAFLFGSLGAPGAGAAHAVPDAQPASAASAFQPFTGTWQARLQGDTFFTIKLALQQGRLSGSTNRVDLSFGKNGEVVHAKPLEGVDPILDATLSDGVLRIMTEDDDSVRLEIRLTGPDQAELRIFSLSDPTPIKPLRLDRIKGK